MRASVSMGPSRATIVVSLPVCPTTTGLTGLSIGTATCAVARCTFESASGVLALDLRQHLNGLVQNNPLQSILIGRDFFREKFVRLFLHTDQSRKPHLRARLVACISLGQAQQKADTCSSCLVSWITAPTMLCSCNRTPRATPA